MSKYIKLFHAYILKEKQLYLFDIIILFIGVVSIVSMILLWLSFFSSIISLILGAIFTIFFITLFKIKILFTDKRFGIGIAVVLLIALLFRIEPSLYLAGGQDEGLYISMSHLYEKYGEITFPNETKLQLSQESDINEKDIDVPYVPAVEEYAKNEYIIPFYPLHPTWMAIFGMLLGSDNRAYSLTFFSLISIIAFYLLAYELSNRNKYIATFSALLLALIPIHSFFSKFPTTEITALAFTILSFYYLLSFYKQSQKNSFNYIYFILSLLCINAYMYTRMSIFMYFPFYYILLLISVIFLNSSKIKQLIFIYIFAFVLLYIVSIIFYYNNIYWLFVAIYDKGLFRQLGDYWQIKLLGLVIITLAIFILSWKSIFFQKLIKNNAHLVIKTIPFSAVSLIILAFFHLYEIGFTLQYYENIFLEAYGLLYNKWLSITGITTYVFFIHISPLGFILYISALFYFSFKKKNNLFIFLISVLSILFWGYYQIISKVVYYQYYYTRYLLPELIIYSLLLISIFIARIYSKNTIGKIISVIVSFFIITYFCYFSSIHLLKNEGLDNQFFKELKKHISSNDLILLDLSKYKNEIYTPLMYYYDFNAINFDVNKIINKYTFDLLTDKYDDIFILTDNQDICDHDDQTKFSETIPVRYTYFTNGMPHLYRIFNTIEQTPLLPYSKYLIPSSYVIGEYNTYICRYTREKSLINQLNNERKIEFKNNLEYFTKNIYQDGWTNGNGIISNIELPVPSHIVYIVLEAQGFHQWTEDTQSTQNISLEINMNEAPLEKIEDNKLFFKIPEQVSIITDIIIKSDNFIPKKEGLNTDTRKLGINIQSISFSEK